MFYRYCRYQVSLKMVQERLTKTLIGPSVSFFPVDPETQSFIGAAGGGGWGGHAVLTYLHNSLESIVLASSKLKLRNKLSENVAFIT